MLNLIEFYSTFISLTPILFFITIFFTVGGLFGEFLILKYPKYAQYFSDVILQIQTEVKNNLLLFKDEQIKSEIVIILLLVVISLIPRLIFQKGIFDSDDAFYLRNAVLIASKSFRHLLLTDSDHLWIYPVGYPLFLASFFLTIGGEGELPAGILNAVLGSCSVVIIYWITKNITTNRNSAVISAFFVSFQQMHLFESITILADIPGFLFLTLSILMVLKIIDTNKSRHFYLFYAFLGLGTLVRYPNLFVFPLFIIVSIFTKDGFRKLLLRKENLFGILIVLLIMLPQLLYNTIHYGGPFITGYQYYNLAGGDIARYSKIEGRPNPYVWQINDAIELFPIIAYGYIRYLFSFRFISPILTPFYIFGFYRLWRGREKKVGVMLVWFLIYFCFFSFHYIGTSLRFVPYFYPVLLIFGSYGVIKSYDRKLISRNMVNIFRLVILISSVCVIFIFLIYFSILNIWLFVYASGKPLYSPNSITYYPFDSTFLFWIEIVFMLIGGIVLVYFLIKTQLFNKLFLKISKLKLD